ncbi:AEC family transporter [Halothermothrix orenii]|uniref:Auxin Efflux Carrier n=1 Tax=Halothermothrix orenii (strain H 168 / OCM 544 / DSM 9562) TaxID=373903 RepID=B8D1H8_HALOH|nr:AEC family transporter [Halothermothrix orenii]ACL69055.1 Auxin Efflux Carrier [Halothermothrix orenii H 168]
MGIIINQILVLFLIIFLGFVLRKKQLINEEINKGLSNILVDVTLPALIISSMAIEFNPDIMDNIKKIGFISIASYLTVIALVLIFTSKLSLPSKRKTVFKFLLIFGNVGYMGYPVIDTIYPELGILYAVINNIIFNVLVWTFGIYLFIKDEKGSNIKLHNLVNNGLIAVVIGFILFLGNIKLPLPIEGALDKVGEMTFPLSMIIIGSSLTNVRFKTIIKDYYLYLLCLLKLIAIPLIGFLILIQFDLPQIIRDISVLLLAMPAAASGVIFAEKFEGDYKFASEGVFITTLFSLVTIPLFIWLTRIY